VKEELQFYRKALNAYQKRKRREGSKKGQELAEASTPLKTSFIYLQKSKKSAKESNKPRNLLRQMSLARNRRSRQIPEE
jgi:hypothetical protein